MKKIKNQVAAASTAALLLLAVYAAQGATHSIELPKALAPVRAAIEESGSTVRVILGLFAAMSVLFLVLLLRTLQVIALPRVMRERLQATMIGGLKSGDLKALDGGCDRSFLGRSLSHLVDVAGCQPTPSSGPHLAREALERTAGQWAAPNAWFGVIYSISSIIGLALMLVALIGAFETAAGSHDVDRPFLYRALAGALAVTAVTMVLLVMASRVMGEVLTKRAEAVVRERDALVVPVLASIFDRYVVTRAVDEPVAAPAAEAVALRGSRPEVVENRSGTAFAKKLWPQIKRAGSATIELTVDMSCVLATWTANGCGWLRRRVGAWRQRLRKQVLTSNGEPQVQLPPVGPSSGSAPHHRNGQVAPKPPERSALMGGEREG